jgi:hypothetical protein
MSLSLSAIQTTCYEVYDNFVITAYTQTKKNTTLSTAVTLSLQTF